MTDIRDRVQAFFFARRAALSFGMMRILWGITTFSFLLMQWKDVVAYESDAGYLPMSLLPLVARSANRFSILDFLTQPSAVFALYLLLLLLLLMMTVGWKARWTTIGSVLLLFSFHERNTLVLAGGDTVLRVVGFLLMISPGIEALSLDRSWEQWKKWKKNRALLPPLTMPMWPYRLLLWQFVVLYGTALWYKLLGTMWLQGTAVATVLHHPVFAPDLQWLMHFLSAASPVLGSAVLLFHASWLLLLIPRPLLDRTGIGARRLKWIILTVGLLFHGSILLMLRAGSFSPALFAGYCGLLDGEDIAAVKRFLNRSVGKRKITVLYDGRCGLCLRTIFVLQLLDALNRLQYINFWNGVARATVAPRLTIDQLNRALHVKIRGRFFTGFDALRALAARLPALVPFAPLLFLPGVPSVGRRIYARIAARRANCSHKRCLL